MNRDRCKEQCQRRVDVRCCNAVGLLRGVNDILGGVWEVVQAHLAQHIYQIKVQQKGCGSLRRQRHVDAEVEEWDDGMVVAGVADQVRAICLRKKPVN